MCDDFCSSLSLFIWRFTFSELFCKNIKLKWEDIQAQVYARIKTIKTIDQSFMTSLKIYLQQSYIVFKISSTQINVHIDTSYTRKCTTPLVRRYQAKLTCDIHKTSDQNFWRFFNFFMVFELFNTLKNIICKVRSTKTTSTKQT